jgi:N6-adenosine-specific RNA methylase IME4
VSELLLRDRDGVTLAGAFSLTRTGLVVTGEPTYEEWQRCGEFLNRVGASVQWLIGDWLNYGERRWGETYTQAVEMTGLDISTLQKVKWVSSVIESCRRRQELSFAHHHEAASLPPAEADALLTRAEADGLSTREVRALVKQAKAAAAVGAPVASEQCCTVADLTRVAARGLKFGTVYADPPWRYDNQGTRAATDNHYGTMSVDEIAALPVGDLAADRSHLWLWTTNAFLFECPRIFAAWGFEFKSSFVWVKPQMGIGNYLRNSHEFLLLATRGGLTAAAHDVMSWGEFDRTEHSAKPERIRVDVIERISPGPRLELFGRKLVQGWAVWGNQIESSLFDGEIESI